MRKGLIVALLDAIGLVVIGLAVTGLVLPGCRAAGDSASSPSRQAPPQFKVALLTPGPISDAGWNASAYEGLERIRAELGAEIAHVETKTPPEFEEGFREYAADGYQLVFGHGFEFQDAAAKVGAEFPDAVFITSSGSTVRENVAPIVFRLEEATYLLGMTAALWSPESRAGTVGGMEIPSVESTFIAFEAGFESVRKDAPVLSAYIGSWDDVSAAKEATLAQIRNGATFILHNADAAGLGALRAVAEASTAAKPLYAFGANRDQAAVAPTAVLASAVLDIPAAFVQVARAVRDGSFEPRVMEMGMASGVVTLAWNKALVDRVPAPVMARVEAARRQIVDGQLEVPKGF